MSASAPTLINLPPLPRPQTINDVVNNINRTYTDINRAFNIIGAAFQFNKTQVVSYGTITGTQIGGFLIGATSLTSVDGAADVRVGIYSSASPVFTSSFVVGDPTNGPSSSIVGNGIVYGHFVVNSSNLTVAEMRKGTADSHGFLAVRKSDNTVAFSVTGSTKNCIVGNDLAIGNDVTVARDCTVARDFIMSGGGAGTCNIGTNTLRFGTYTAGAPAATGYMTFVDAAGNTRKLLTG